MTEPLSIFVPGLPQPQGSARAFVVGKRAIVTSDNPKVKSWRQDIAAQIGQREPFLDGVIVALRFWFPRPTAHYGAQGALKARFERIWKITRPDLDKAVRSALDALTIACVYRDDSQVVKVDAAKLYVSDQFPIPGVRIEAWEASNGND